MNDVSREQEACWYIGLDVSKATFDAGLLAPGQHFPATPLSALPAAKFKRNEEGVQQLLKWLDKHCPSDVPVRVVMEATGRYSEELAQILLAAPRPLDPAIVNPRQTSAFVKSMGLRNKTDKLEARALAFYGAERRPAAYEPMSADQAELRALCRYRDDLVRQRTAEKNRLSEQSETPFVRKMQERRLEQVDKDIARVEVHMRRLVMKTEWLHRDIDLLSSIYGVAFITASVVMSELGDLRRFTRARQLTAFAGLSPRHFTSGTSVQRKPRLCKAGSPAVHHVLYLAAITAIRGDNDLSDTYHELIDKGKPFKVAICAIMRKLLVTMRAMLISGESYRPRQHVRG